MILLLLALFSLVRASEVKILNVDAMGETYITLNLKAGQKVTGSFSITGGVNQDLNFWVTRPSGSNIIDYGRVFHGADFNFTAEQDGAYGIHFGNPWLFSTSKQVTVTYDVAATPIFGLDPFIFIVVTAGGLITIFVIAGLFYRKRQSKQKTTQPLSPPPPPSV